VGAERPPSRPAIRAPLRRSRRPARPSSVICLLLGLTVYLAAPLPPSSAQPPLASATAFVDQGVALAREGRFPEAIATLEQALLIDPTNRDAHYNLAVACHNAGDQRRAIQEFQTVLRNEPDAADARKGLGLAQLALRDPGAAASLRAALELVPNDPVAQLGLGRAYMYAGNPRKALGPLKRANELLPRDATAAFELGKAQAALKQHAEARRSFLRALTLKPESPGAAAGLARSMTATGQALAAVQVLARFAEQPAPDRDILSALAAAYDALKLTDEALQTRARLAAVLPPKDALPVRLALGNALLRKLRFGEAMQQFVAATEADPRSADAHMGLARCYRGLADSPNEVGQWLTASGLAPKDPRTWIGLGEALNARRDDRGALGALDRALRIDPVNRAALELAARAAGGLGEKLLAETYLRRVLALAPADLRARTAVVDALVEQGRLGEAMLEMSEAIRLPGAAPDAIMKVAFLAEQVANYDIAIAEWRRLMKLGGKHEVPAALELGRLLVRAARVPEAIELYREQLQKHPRAAELSLGLARAHQAIGQDDEAALLLQPVVAANPALNVARVCLAESLSWLGRHQEAFDLMQQAAGGGSLDAEACRTLLLVCQRAGRLDEARVLLEKLTPLGAPEDGALDTIADIYRGQHRETEGAARLLAILDRHPTHPRLGLTAAKLLTAAGRTGEAERILRALSLREGYRTTALRQLVRMHLATTAPERGLAPLRELVEADPRAASTVAMLAELAVRPDLVRAALPVLADLAAADLGTPAFWVATAKLSHSLGRTATEAARMEALAVQSPTDPGVAAASAALALAEGRPAVAEKAVLRVPRQLRDDRVLLHLLAEAQLALSRPQDAVDTVHQASANDRGVPEDYVLCAQALRQLRHCDDAVLHLAMALRLDPGTAAARDMLREMMARAEAPSEVFMEAFKYVYRLHPDTPVVFELVDALAERVDARQVCYDWLNRHPRPGSVPIEQP
jgi:tetratricopeptide (TPR) repeat protein